MSTNTRKLQQIKNVIYVRRIRQIVSVYTVPSVDMITIHKALKSMRICITDTAKKKEREMSSVQSKVNLNTYTTSNNPNRENDDSTVRDKVPNVSVDNSFES